MILPRSDIIDYIYIDYYVSVANAINPDEYLE